MTNQKRSILNRLWYDQHGKLAIVGWPNTPLTAWLLAMGLGWLLPTGHWQTLAKVLSFGALFTWAWLELFDGVNYFRRALGLVVLMLVILSAVMHNHL